MSQNIRLMTADILVWVVVGVWLGGGLCGLICSIIPISVWTDWEKQETCCWEESTRCVPHLTHKIFSVLKYIYIVIFYSFILVLSYFWRVNIYRFKSNLYVTLLLDCRIQFTFCAEKTNVSEILIWSNSLHTRIKSRCCSANFLRQWNERTSPLSLLYNHLKIWKYTSQNIWRSDVRTYVKYSKLEMRIF